MKKNRLTTYIDSFLKIAEIEDSSYNGLQIDGKDELKKVAFAVDSGIEVFEKAKKENADMLIVHHGLYWNRSDPRLIAANKKRIDVLLSANINLYAAHLPLDMHGEVGNNVELIRISGAKLSGRFYKYTNDFLGALGKFDSPKKVGEIAKILEEKLSAKTHILGESREISTVAAVSGGIGLEAVVFAKEAGADLLIVGEKRDFYHCANDFEISVIFAGHHSSEQVGIWALMRHVREKFPEIEYVYIDCPTGL